VIIAQEAKGKAEENLKRKREAQKTALPAQQ